jgi:hypothetical protein
MNSKRSMWMLLLGVAGVGLLVTNCTLKTASDNANGGASNNSSAGAGNAFSGHCSPVGDKFSGCICSGNVVSYQTCGSDGIYGACACATSTEGGASSGGASSDMGGASNAGTAPAAAGATSSDAGAGGDAASGAVDCYTCLIANCAPEWAACAAEDESHPPDPGAPDQYCLSSNGPPGQIEKIMTCITTERSGKLAKRDVVRACGSTLGASANPKNVVWAPPDMTPATEALMNCMADSPTETTPGAWATDMTTNFPNGMPRPWDAMTCAKDSCTSAL